MSISRFPFKGKSIQTDTITSYTPGIPIKVGSLEFPPGTVLYVDTNGTHTGAIYTGDIYPISGAGTGIAIDGVTITDGGSVGSYTLTSGSTVLDMSGGVTITLDQDVSSTSSPTFVAVNTDTIIPASGAGSAVTVDGVAITNGGSVGSYTITSGTTVLDMSGGVTITLDQDVSTTSSPTFAAITSGPLNGVTITNGGSVGSYTITSGTTVLNMSGGVTISLDQDVSTTSSPTFVDVTATNEIATDTITTNSPFGTELTLNAASVQVGNVNIAATGIYDIELTGADSTKLAVVGTGSTFTINQSLQTTDSVNFAAVSARGGVTSYGIITCGATAGDVDIHAYGTAPKVTIQNDLYLATGMYLPTTSGTAGLLSFYQDPTDLTATSSGAATTVTGTVTLTRIGDIVTGIFKTPGSFTTTVANKMYFNGIISSLFRPQVDVRYITHGRDVGTSEFLVCDMLSASGDIVFSVGSGATTFSIGSNSNIYPFGFSYVV